MEIKVRVKVKEVRLEKGISIRELEKETKINRGRLSEIENNKANTGIHSLCKIAKALDCTLDEIVEYEIQE